jgi:threonine dehydrogenase-like Zn-dependent dehydrogenase
VRALTVRPGVPGSLGLCDVGEPRPGEGPLLVEGLAVGLCGTDTEIIGGGYGAAPPGEQVLVLGHENLGRVQQAPPDSGFSAGDLVVGIVRRPDPEPCPACAAGEWDMCRLIGAGPVGLLAALLGVQRGLRVHVFDRVTDGRKPVLVRSLGATYHHDSLPASGLRPDVVVECTGAPQAVVDVLTHTGIDAIVCLTGVSAVGSVLPLDVGGLNREAVLGNDVIFGTVNANKRHYDEAARALAAADRKWLSRVITRVVPLHRYGEAFTRHPDDVKVVLDLQETGR